MAINTFVMIYDINPDTKSFENLGLIYLFYGFIWLL